MPRTALTLLYFLSWKVERKIFRFTDLVREDKEIAKSVANLDREIRMSQSGALRRIQNNIERTVPILKKEDGSILHYFFLQF